MADKAKIPDMVPRGRVEHVIRMYTTPNTLRTIADDMEEKYSKALCGDSTLVSYIRLDGDNVLEIRYDQEGCKFEKEMRDNG